MKTNFKNVLLIDVRICVTEMQISSCIPKQQIFCIYICE